MSVLEPLAASPVGCKRFRCAAFPGDFTGHLLRLLSTRSAFIRTQLECVAEDAHLQLPEETGSLWLTCVLSTAADLQSASDETLAVYLKASEFFQDWEMVKHMCLLLGRRLFTVIPKLPCRKQHIAKVLNPLSPDLVMEVLRKAPGSLASQLAQLPQSLAPLAVLAQVPALSAVCTAAPEDSSTPQLPSSGQARITIHVDVNTAQHQHTCSSQPQDSPAQEQCPPRTAASQGKNTSFDGRFPDSSSDSRSQNARIWLRCAEVTPDRANTGLFSLETRPETVVCHLVSRKRTWEKMSIALPDSACLVFGKSTGNLELKNVSFHGGTVVCTGKACDTTFEDVSFDKCSLLVLSKAQATLHRPQFFNCTSGSRTGLSLMVHGSGSRAYVKGGTVRGGIQGVSVQCGGSVEAKDFSLRELEVVGVEAQGEGSELSLTSCEVKDFADVYDGVQCCTGVYVHSKGNAHLRALSVFGMAGFGVCVATGAVATLVECTSADVYSCVRIRDGGTAHMSGCTLCRGGDAGLAVAGAGSTAVVTSCHFGQNMCGVHTSAGAIASVSECTTTGCECCGFVAVDKSTMYLKDTTSDQDKVGAKALLGGKVIATGLKVSGSRESGLEVCSGEMALQNCVVEQCEMNGVSTDGEGSHVHAESCRFLQNGGCAVIAGACANVTVKDCHSRDNGEAGFYAKSLGRMIVSSSTSEDEGPGFAHSAAGQVWSHDLTVTGTNNHHADPVSWPCRTPAPVLPL